MAREDCSMLEKSVASGDLHNLHPDLWERGTNVRHIFPGNKSLLRVAYPGSSVSSLKECKASPAPLCSEETNLSSKLSFSCSFVRYCKYHICGPSLVIA